MISAKTAKRILLRIIVITGATILALIIWVLYSLGAFRSNQAQAELSPIQRGITSSLHGKLLCDNGDNGHTIDNSVPWYTVYYSVDATSKTLQQIKDLSAKQGFTLQDSAQTTQQGISQPVGGSSTFLTANNNGKQLDIQIVGQGDKIALYCGKDYGKEESPAGGKNLVELSMTLPDTSK